MGIVALASLAVVTVSVITAATAMISGFGRLKRLRVKLQALADHPTLQAAQRAPMLAAPLVDASEMLNEIAARLDRITAAIAVTSAAIERLAFLSRETKRAYEEFAGVVGLRRF